MSTGHSHGQVRAGHEKILWIALALTTTFLIAEIIGAWVTGSLALLSDAAHMFTDSAALAISLAAMQIAKRIADRKRTFGYYRFEILAAAFNAILLVLVAMYILYEAYQRLRLPVEIQTMGMLFIAVIAAAIIIHYTGWNWVDSMVAAAIGLWVLPRTWTLLKESINILLQGVPKGIDLEVIESALRGIDGVYEIHDLHVWSLTSGKNVLSVHVVTDSSRRTDQEILTEVDRIVRGFEITHTTIQVETDGFHAQHAPCADDSGHIHRHDD